MDPTVKLTFLGTSSAMPTRCRNTSAIYLQADGMGFLFDSGEGVQKQMLIAGLNPMKLKAVFISHIHYDHVLGLPGLLSTLALLNRNEPLTVVGPRKVNELLETLEDRFYMNLPYEIQFAEAGQGPVYRAGPIEVHSHPTVHSVESYAYKFVYRFLKRRFYPERAISLGVPRGPLWGKLQLGQAVEVKGKLITPEMVSDSPPEPVTITISGDTAFYAGLVEFYRGSDLLIHEATFDKSLQKRADEMLHSTTHDAARAAALSGARKLIIYHYSERYTDVSALEAEARELFKDALAAVEFTSVEFYGKDINVIMPKDGCGR